MTSVCTAAKRTIPNWDATRSAASAALPVGSHPSLSLSLALGANLVDFFPGRMLDPRKDVLNRLTELGQASEVDRRMHVQAKSARLDSAGIAGATRRMVGRDIELRILKGKWRGRRGSNPRPPA